MQGRQSAYRFKNWFYHADGGSFGWAFKGPLYDGNEVFVRLSRVQTAFRGVDFFPRFNVLAVPAPFSRPDRPCFIVPEALDHLYMRGELVVNDRKRGMDGEPKEGEPFLADRQMLLVNIRMV